MPSPIDNYFSEDPILWVDSLPDFQSAPIKSLLAKGLGFEDVAQSYISATASNTYRFSATSPVGNKDSFLQNIKKEFRGFLCGDKKYNKEREGLFGEKAPARTFVISTIAVSIAPHLGVAAPVVAPIVALLLAAIGKIAITAWCSTTAE